MTVDTNTTHGIGNSPVQAIAMYVVIHTVILLIVYLKIKSEFRHFTRESSQSALKAKTICSEQSSVQQTTFPVNPGLFRLDFLQSSTTLLSKR